MHAARPRPRLRWASKKRAFRRRWPVYLTLVIICVTTVALAILIASDIDQPSKTPPTPVPQAIR
jgi:hypothetical protein